MKPSSTMMPRGGCGVEATGLSLPHAASAITPRRKAARRLADDGRTDGTVERETWAVIMYLMKC
jgi:hypothetical protein